MVQPGCGNRSFMSGGSKIMVIWVCVNIWGQFLSTLCSFYKTIVPKDSFLKISLSKNSRYQNQTSKKNLL